MADVGEVWVVVKDDQLGDARAFAVTTSLQVAKNLAEEDEGEALPWDERMLIGHHIAMGNKHDYLITQLPVTD